MTYFFLFLLNNCLLISKFLKIRYKICITIRTKPFVEKRIQISLKVNNVCYRI